MNKKQIGAFLKVMSKDKSRAVLCSAYIDLYNNKPVMVATDAYILSAVYLPDLDKSYVGKRITREAIEKWYKLADGRIKFNGSTIQDLMEDDVYNNRAISGQYPDWQSVIKINNNPTNKIGFNADYAKIIQELNGSDGLTYSLNGDLGAMVSDTELAFSMIMPLRNK